MKPLKPYHGIIVLVICYVILFCISPFLGEAFGIYGSFLGELLILLSAIGTALLSKGNLSCIFPLKRPKLAALFGSGLLWGSTLLAGMIITLILGYFFPKQVFEVSQGMSGVFVSMPFIVSFFMVAVAPAICEEAVFRGVLLNSFQPLRNKWLIIILTGAIFGAFHGSIWRFLPTAMLGILFAYIVMETGNLSYSVILHGVNNGYSIVLLYVAQFFLRLSGVQDIGSLEMTAVPLVSVGSYLMFGSIIPFAMYIGNYLIHKGIKGYRSHLFPKENIRTILILAVVTAVIFISGFVTILYGLLIEPNIIRDMIGQ